MRAILTLFIFCLSLTHILAQRPSSPEVKKVLDKANSFAQAKKYDKAKSLLLKAKSKYPEELAIVRDLATLSLDVQDYEGAIVYLQELTQEGTSTNPKVYYSIYKAQMMLGNYGDAVAPISQAIDLLPKDSDNAREALRDRANLLFMIDAMKHPVAFDPQILPETINSEWSEYLPSIALDGTILFTRRLSGQEDIYQSRLDTAEQFATAIPVEQVNTAGNEGGHFISADGNTLLLSIDGRRDGFGSFDIYYTVRKDGSWVPLKNIGKNINTSGWEAQPSLSADGKTLFFASQRNGGVGGKDIYTSQLQKDGSWGIATILDTTINTMGSEESPFIHPDGETLYFRSNGHVGMGDFDIYMSKYKDDKWQAPINIGYPINTPGSEGALFVDILGEKAYYASDAGRDNLDIFVFDLPYEARPKPISYMVIQVVDKQTGEGLVTEVSLKNLQESGELNLSTDREGKLSQILPIDGNYAVTVSREGYTFYSANIGINAKTSPAQPYLYTIALEKIASSAVELRAEKQEPIVLNNLFFDTGSADLLPESNFEIQTLYNLLLNHPSMEIQLIGHTDNVGEAEANQILSEKRAESVLKALMAKGIERGKLTAVGRGENQPIASNDTESGRRKNRRTEMVILKY